MIYFSIFPLLEGLPGDRPAVEVEQVEGEEDRGGRYKE